MNFNKFLAVSMSAVLSLTLVGCSTTSSAKELKGEELNKIQKDDKEKENYLVIDVKNIDKDLAALLPADKNAPVYTYCYSGNRSSKAAQKAVELGYTNVFNAFDGAKEHEYKF